MRLPAGTRCGPYVIVAPIGAGGMGEVYRARDSRLGREVAIKILPPDESGEYLATSKAQRFLREARAASGLNHPNIVAIYDIGKESETHYIVLELVSGESLRAHLRLRPFPVAEVIKIAQQLADALQFAHDAGVVHRDLKPDNVMLPPDGKVKILDFGLAKMTRGASGLGDAETQMQTSPGVVMGTAAYMSPEQARGDPIDFRSDQFSFGVLLYEMLTGKQVFKRPTAVETMMAIIRDDPPNLPIGVPAVLAGAIARCLAKNPYERYSSLREFQRELASINLSAGDEVTQQLEPLDVTQLTDTPATGSRLTTRTATRGLPPAIAVLPFADLSPERDQAYFCDGLAEEIINALARVDGLRVVSRGSSFAFRSSPDPREMGIKLNVTTVLEGGIRKAGNRLRITARLVKTIDGFQIWAERYECELKDIFDIQDEIAPAIAHALKIKLEEEQQQQIRRRYTESVEAYNFYLKGRYQWNKRTPETLRSALEYFEKALVADPEYALAYSGIADSVIVPGYYGLALPSQVMPRGKAAVQRALTIDPNLAEGHTTLGMIRSIYDYQWRAGEESFRRALELNPNYAVARMWLSMFNLAPRGRMDEALEEARKAHDLDPLSAATFTVLGAGYYHKREYSKAVEELSRTIEYDPNFAIAHLFLGQTYSELGQYDNAEAHLIKSIDLFGNNPGFLGPLGHMYGVAGKRAAALEVLDRVTGASPERYVSRFTAALVCLGLGEHDRALDFANEAADERAIIMLWLDVDPRWDKLRGNPRFSALVKKLCL